MYEFTEVELYDKFILAINIPHAYLGMIIGKRGENLKNLEKSTHTHIHIPDTRHLKKSTEFNEFQPVTIKISSTDESDRDPSPHRVKPNCYKAATRIELLIHKNRSKIDFTHYISINLYEQEIFLQRKQQFIDQLFETFPEIFGKSENDPKRDNYKFILKNHQTMAMATITSKSDLDAVKNMVRNANARVENFEFLKNYPTLDLEYQGLNILDHESANNCRVLFTKPKNLQKQDYLQEFYEIFIKLLQELDIPTETRHERLLQHVTLINNKKSIKKADGSNLPSLDASQILEKFQNFHFGKFSVKNFSLVNRGDKRNEDLDSWKFEKSGPNFGHKMGKFSQNGRKKLAKKLRLWVSF